MEKKKKKLMATAAKVVSRSINKKKKNIYKVNVFKIIMTHVEILTHSIMSLIIGFILYEINSNPFEVNSCEIQSKLKRFYLITRLIFFK